MDLDPTVETGICNALAETRLSGTERQWGGYAFDPSATWVEAFRAYGSRLRRLLGADCAACDTEIPPGDVLAHGRFLAHGYGIISYASAPLCASCWAKRGYHPACVAGPMKHPIHRIICPACGRAFYRRSSDRLQHLGCTEACSYRLRREAANANRKRYSTPAPSYQCATCGDDFTGRRSSNYASNPPTYCSSACRQTAYRSRLRRSARRQSS